MGDAIVEASSEVREHRDFFDVAASTSWNVIEQKAVDKAKELCQDPCLTQGFLEIPKFPPTLQTEDGDFLVGVWVRIPKGMLG